MASAGASPKRGTRTLLEQRIRERNLTYDEFVEYAERFARETNEPGTLSLRHLQRLASGERSGRSISVRPVTARLLERIFQTSIDELLQAPTGLGKPDAHLLRVAVAIVMRGDNILVVCRRGDDAGLYWQFPAGMVKPGRSAEAVAVRETLAETGVHCVVAESLGSRLHPVTNVHCDYVLCTYVAGDAVNLDPMENESVLWVGRDELTRLIPPDQIFAPVASALTLCV